MDNLLFLLFKALLYFYAFSTANVCVIRKTELDKIESHTPPSHNNFLVFECKLGFRKKHSGQIKCESTGLVNSKKAHVTIFCEKITRYCSKVPKTTMPAIGYVNSEKILICEMGYTHEENKEKMRCVGDTEDQGQWKVSGVQIDECTLIEDYCQEPVLHTTVEFETSPTQNSISQTFTAQCKKSSEGRSSLTFTCSKMFDTKGVWSYNDLEIADYQCDLKAFFCPVLQVNPQKEVKILQFSRSLGQVISLVCNKGYSPPLSPAVCTDGGRWSGSQHCVMNSNITGCRPTLVTFNESRKIECTGTKIDDFSVQINEAVIEHTVIKPDIIDFSVNEHTMNTEGGVMSMKLVSNLIEFSKSFPIRYTSNSSKVCADQKKWFDSVEGACQSCNISGVICPGVGISIPEITHWSLNETTMPVICPNKEACAGNLFMNTTANFSMVCSVLNGTGYNGTLCDQCFEGFYNDNFVCKKCQGSASDSSIAIPMSVSMLFYAGLSIGATMKPKISGLIFIGAVCFGQLAEALRMIFSSRDIFFFTFFDIFNLKLGYLRQFCSNNNITSFSSLFWYQLLFAVGVMALFCATASVKWLIFKRRIQATLIEKVLNSLVFFNMIAYKGILILALSAFTCINYPWGEDAPTNLSDRFCPLRGSFVIKVVGALLIVVHSVGFPVFLFVIKHRALPTAFVLNGGEGENDVEEEKFQFLFYHFKTRNWMFVGIFFVSDIMFAMRPIFYGSVMLYASLTAVPLGIIAIIVAFLMPFEKRVINQSAIAAYTIEVGIIAVCCIINSGKFHLFNDGMKSIQVASYVLLSLSGTCLAISILRVFMNYGKSDYDYSAKKMQVRNSEMFI